MAIQFQCNKCSHTLQVPDQHAGRKAKCPNCGQVLPIPGAVKGASKPKAKPTPRMPGKAPIGGPIPTTAGGRRPKKVVKKAAKPSDAAGKAVPRGDKPPEMRSGKRPLMLGVVLVVLLGAALFVWKGNLFRGKEKPSQPEPRTTARSRTPQRTSTGVSKLTDEEKGKRTSEMEAELLKLEMMTAVKPFRPDVDAQLVSMGKTLEKFSKEMGLASNARDGLSRSVADNKEWFYGRIFARAGELLSQYRFETAKQLLADCVPAVSAASSTAKPTGGRRGARRAPTRVTARQKCADLAKSDLLRVGLEGKVCIWTNRLAEDSEPSEFRIELDPPEESQYFVTHAAGSGADGGATGPEGGPRLAPTRRSRSNRTSSRNRQASSVQWATRWSSASNHLTHISAMQRLAERSGQPAMAAALYGAARKLEEKCTSFETAGEEDAALMERLSQRTADKKVQEKIRSLISQCRYFEAESKARGLLSESPGNPENWRWLVRCYLESCNAVPMAIDRNDLLRRAQGTAKTSKYEVMNGLLAVNLMWPELPEGIGGQEYRDLVSERTAKLTETSGYAGKYDTIAEWLKAESIDIALQDFRFRPFLAGEPIELVGRKGVLYTLYGQHGPEGQPTLIVTREVSGFGEAGVYVQMPDGWRYQVVNAYPPEHNDIFPGDSVARSISKPMVKPVTALGQIRTSSLGGQNTLPVISRISVLRCEQSSSSRTGGAGSWELSIPRSALPREQVSQPNRRGSSSRSPSRTPRTSSRDGSASPFVQISFGSGRSSRRPTSGRNGNGQVKVEVITCLVRSVRTEVAFFNDEKGAYLIGADGKRFYSDGKGMLRAEDKSGLVWNVALEDRACPRELQVQMVRYYGVSNSGSSSRGPSYGGPVRPNGGAPDKGQLTTSSAAQWLGQIAGQGSKSGGQKQRGPVAGRWLETDGRRIVQVGGQMLEAGPAGLSNELFYSVEDAGELLQMAKKLCDSSLESWPTLGGQVYRRINSERLERLIGQSSNKQRRTTAPGMSYGKPSRTTSRKSRRVGQASIEPYEESERARGSFLAGDNNRTLAISGDLTAAWSLRIQQGINEDAVGAIVKVQGVGETIGSDGDDPKALFGPDIKSQALDKTTYITGRRPGTNATKRGTDSNGGQRDLQVGERLFLDSRMLAEGCFLRAVSLGKAGLGYEARKAARHGELRVRCFFLAELQEWLRKRQGGRHTLPSELAGVEEDWQKIVEPSDSVGLQRALQAARGEAVTVAWPEVSAKSGSAGSSGKQGSGFLGSLLGSKKIEGSETRPIRAAMTLEAWLDTGNSQREKLPARQVLVSSQFDWGRAVISGTGILKGEKGKETEGEGLALTTERAEEIIRLAGAYESSGRADAATAEALWELGSYAACVGLIEEAQDCLGQAGTAYIQLAEEAAASFNAYGYGGPDIAALREYYKNRTAALLCLAHAGAVEELGGWPDNSVLVLGEVGAKLSQLERQWSDAAGSGTVSGVLQAASDLVESAKTSRSEVGYEYPRKRFWWWHYPFRKQQSQLASDRRQRTGSSVSRRAATRPPLIYDPGAKNQRGQPIMAPGGMPAPQFLPTPGERYGI